VHAGRRPCDDIERGRGSGCVLDRAEDRPLLHLPKGVSIGAMTEDRSQALEALAARRWRVALLLTAGMLVTYFGFVLLVAYDKPLLGQAIAPGLSLGILLGASVILVAWVLTGLYVRWTNRVYDAELARVRALPVPERSGKES